MVNPIFLCLRHLFLLSIVPTFKFVYLETISRKFLCTDEIKGGGILSCVPLENEMAYFLVIKYSTLKTFC